MDFKLPELGEGVYEAEAVRWLVQPGETVKPGQPLLEVLTDKATMEVPAPFAGSIDSLAVAEGDKLKIGQVLLSYQLVGVAAEGGKKAKSATKPTGRDVGDAASVANNRGASKEEKPTHVTSSAAANGPSTAVKAAPSVRVMARKLGIDLGTVRGSGPQGRVLIEDLSRALGHGPARPQAVKPDYGTPGTRIKFAGVRRKVAEHMVKAHSTIPHYSYVDECDVSDLVALRGQLKEAFANKGVRLTYLAFFVKAAALALKDVPIVNASLDDDKEEIVLHDSYHIGVATAVPGGLIVPVVRDADRRGVLDIARDIERLSNEARAGKVKLEDLRGGTFTVTSIGNIGGLFSTPIIHHPQVGILGIGKIVQRPVFDERGQVKAADMLYLSFAFDHRVLDGAVGCAFGNALIERLKRPAELLLEN